MGSVEINGVLGSAHFYFLLDEMQCEFVSFPACQPHKNSLISLHQQERNTFPDFPHRLLFFDILQPHAPDPLERQRARVR